MINVLSFLDYEIDNVADHIKNSEKVSKYIYFVDSVSQANHYFMNGISFMRLDFMSLHKMESINPPIEIFRALYSKHGQIFKIMEQYRSALKIKNSYSSLQKRFEEIITYMYSLIHYQKIKELWFIDIPHLPLEFVAYSLAKELNIKTKILFWMPADVKFQAKQSVFLLEDLSKISENTQSFENESNNRWSDKNSYSYLTSKKSRIRVEGYDQKLDFKTRIKIVRFKIRQFGVLRSSIIMAFKLINMISLILINLKIKSILRYSERLANPMIPDEVNYYYFPLHYQPEATTQVRAGVIDNQILMIKSIVKFLPSGCKLIVKEHPAYYSKIKSLITTKNKSVLLHRSKEFYNSIMSEPNTILVSINTSQEELIDRSIGVISVSGSVAIECYNIKKPILLFGITPYIHLENVTFAQDDTTISDFINSSYIKSNHIIPNNKTLLNLLENSYQIDTVKYRSGSVNLKNNELISLIHSIYY
jgi:hypothetical protein